MLPETATFGSFCNHRNAKCTSWSRRIPAPRADRRSHIVRTMLGLGRTYIQNIKGSRSKEMPGDVRRTYLMHLVSFTLTIKDKIRLWSRLAGAVHCVIWSVSRDLSITACNMNETKLNLPLFRLSIIMTFVQGNPFQPFNRIGGNRS
jgi:hypothetical protein